MSAPAIIRADWSRVTLAEYAAVNLLARPDTEAVLNWVWDDIHEHNPFRGDTPNRLTVEGSAWLAELRTTVTTTGDEREVIRSGRELVKCLGILTVMAAGRLTR